ncbi:MAG: lysylphosphatidylglycerol synthase transmembrane domain-containing protein [Candidatus Sulfotelmatobacter sp.]
MNKQRVITYGLVLVVLAVLLDLQFRAWRTFDWSRFFSQTRDIAWLHVIYGTALIYLTYVLRAVRWKIFLRPVRRDISSVLLLSPTIIGFTGLALLGRPGELIRPYLIARRLNLNLSSQMAVWTIERIFDLAGFTVLLISATFLPTELRDFAGTSLAVDHWLHLATYLLMALVAGLLSAAVLINYRGAVFAAWIERRFSHLAAGPGKRMAQRIREFATGLSSIHGPLAFLQQSILSVLMWWLIALAYKEVTHAYGAPMQSISATKVLLLLGFSMVGSMLQLPGVGGGSQLATIEALNKIFLVPRELAVSCGILLWLVSFVSVIPVGLLLAHWERLSLRRISDEAEEQEEATKLSSVPPDSSKCSLFT